MSRPALALPSRTPWVGLAESVPFTDSDAGPEPFDVLAYGTAAAEQALRVALAQRARVHALVLAAALPPADRGLAEQMAGLELPTLALFGTRDAGAPPATARLWRALLPGCHVVFVYDAGSELATDRPEAFAGIVLEFLADPGAFLVNRRSGVLHP